MDTTLFGQLDIVAIDRIKEFEPEGGYHVAYSGGKDSDVILDLVRRSGCAYSAHYYLTTVDPPELVLHCKSHQDVMIDRPKMTMWELIRKKGMPPRRNARYCCQVLKESHGDGIIVTGVRWAESSRRAKRRMFEPCFRNRRKRYLHPIIDWRTSDVWDYIHERKIEYCSLYDEGWKRLGCVMCPMSDNKHREMIRWPKIARAWERAIKATFKPGGPFKTPEEYWQWWLCGRAIEDDRTHLFFED